MENKKRALGRGLEQLFNSENLDLDTIEERIYEDVSKDEIIEVSLDELRPNPYQPRKVFDAEALEELAASIKENGVFQPIIIKKSIKGYEIIAGERRVRASKLAGLNKIPAIIRDFTDNQMITIALLENLQRENLSAIEEAYAYKAMIEKLDLTQEQLSEKIGKSRSYVTNIIGLLRLPKEVQKMVANKDVSMAHARILSKLDQEEEILNLSEKVKNDKISVRDLEDLVEKKEIVKKNKITRNTVNTYKYIEDALREKLDTKIKINDKKIVISFSNDADLNRILEILEVSVN